MNFRISVWDRPVKTHQSFKQRFFVAMVFSWTLLLSISVLSVVAQANEKTENVHGKLPTTAGAKHDSAHWDYLGIEGPKHWGMLSEEYMTCETGGRQSPIDIQMPRPGDHQDTLVFDYETSEIHELNNGHTIQVSHKSGCNVGLNNRIYQLRQFHFHEPSEHHIGGKAFPMEMHLVHQDERGRILVIAVMMEIGTTQPVLDNFWNWLPDQIGKEVSIPLEVKLSEILPSNTDHFSYSGSLTTPPCTEGVQWVVLKDSMKISQVDVQRFVEIIGHNARPIQSLGDREVGDR